MGYLYSLFLIFLLWEAGIDVPIVLIAGTLVYLLLPLFFLFYNFCRATCIL